MLLLVAETQADGTLRALLERATITRLGEGVDRERRLRAVAVRRTLDCLESYARDLDAERPHKIAILGTSALRDAAGADAFRARVRALLGAEIEVISGEREARLAFAGATAGLAVCGDVVVVDLGGGSTEIIQGTIPTIGTPNVSSATSFDMGSVRFLERHLAGDPPTREEIQALRMDVQCLMADCARPALGASLVGVAGTVTTLATVTAGIPRYTGELVHGTILSQASLEATLRRLLALPLADRKRVPGLPSERADAVVAGGLILDEILVWANSSSLLVSDRGIRWGRAAELAASNGPRGGVL